MARLALALLGPLQATLDGVPIAGFESQKVRALLAYLALEADRPHARDALAGLLWPNQPDQDARTNLRQALANLRLALGDQRATPPYLRIAGATIQFNRASDHQIDVAVFADLLAACDRHPHRHPAACRSCAQRLQQAIDLYQRDFLAAFFFTDSAAFEEWALLTRERLHQRVLVALVQLAAYHERRGAYAQAQQCARRQLELDPWREESHRQLMRVLALSGQRSAALVQYATCRRVLAAELGVEPEEETTALAERIKRGEVLMDGRATRPSTNIPIHTPLTPFIGRESELAQLADRLERRDCRLLTLVGPGGIGKTRLALQVAADLHECFSDGVCFVPLASLSAAELLIPTIAGALGFALRGAVDAKTQLLGYLRTKDMLLVLDNFEHLRDGVDLLSAILQTAPAVVLLVTSRESLHLRVEWLLDISGLPVPEPTDAIGVKQSSAVQLFVQTARSVQADFALSSANASSVVQICQLVAGTPLAIELAAAWVRSRSCVEIAWALEHSLEQLATTMRDVNPRHRSMRAVFDHSWWLLTAAEQRVLCRLSVFRGGLLEEAAVQVIGATSAVLAALIDKSLLRRNSAGRYDLHELVRQYAGEQLEEAGDAAEIRSQHIGYYLEFAEIAEQRLSRSDQRIWLNRLEQEHDNLRAALAWAIDHMPEKALQLGGALTDFWLTRGQRSEGRKWLDHALAYAGAPPRAVAEAAHTGVPTLAASIAVRAKALYGAGILAQAQQDDARAEPLFVESLALARVLGDSHRIALLLHCLGELASDQSNNERAAMLFTEGLAIARAADDRSAVAQLLYDCGTVAIAQGDLRHAASCFEESLGIRRALGDQGGIARLITALGELAVAQGMVQRAAELFAEGLALARYVGDEGNIAWLLYDTGRLALEQHEMAGAATRFVESARLNHSLGFDEGVALNLAGLAAVAIQQQELIHAARLLGAVETKRDPISWLATDERTEYDRNVAAIRAQLGDATFAAAWAAGRALSLEQAIAEALGASPIGNEASA